MNIKKLFKVNPIVKKDLKVISRSMKYSWGLFAYVAILGIVFIFTMLIIGGVDRYTGSYKNTDIYEGYVSFFPVIGIADEEIPIIPPKSGIRGYYVLFPIVAGNTLFVQIQLVVLEGDLPIIPDCFMNSLYDIEKLRVPRFNIFRAQNIWLEFLCMRGSSHRNKFIYQLFTLRLGNELGRRDCINQNL